MKVRIKWREDLDVFRCGVPDCEAEGNAFFLHAKCHPLSPTWAVYGGGILSVVCAECQKPIVSVAVASRFGNTASAEYCQVNLRQGD
jgi:hypothetical protein